MDFISIIMPVVNEGAALEQYLLPLQPLRQRCCELIVVDGGSSDDSVAIASALADRVLSSERGRALQMNSGAGQARGDVLWFLHGDTRVPEDADTLIRSALARPGRVWGRFDVRLSGQQRLLRVVETLMNLRSCVTGTVTGDQGIFIRREAFERVGGYPAIALMEDIAISKMLKRISRPVCLQQRLVTSSRRWQQNGILRTILLMWTLRLLYFFGVSPERLVRIYYTK
jgi:rSAM/selenodomain-associated transferase 2